MAAEGAGSASCGGQDAPPDGKGDDPTSSPDAPSGAPLLDGAVATQLHGATAELAGQLQAIMNEMHRLKSDLYSSDGGLGGIAAEIDRLKQETSGLAAAPPPSASRRCGGAPRLAATHCPPPRAEAARRVSFDRDAMVRSANGRPADDPRGRRVRRRAAEPASAVHPWTPYVVGLLVVCLGPMRPVLWKWAREAVEGLFESEPAWYDA
ncbi:hypothetical protein AB1Y20_004668 [Prymnesium parvum]|uniref:Peroxin-14 n=1 Tax=Prymnesium parvum TaxID=97485 RepID=A0AB34IYU5_PRYPA